MNVRDFKEYKQKGIPISMVTSYDAWSAYLVMQAGIDSILVGDSAAMVMHGFDSTVPATLEMMIAHTAAVRRGAPGAFIVGDMPFFSFRVGKTKTMENVGKLMQAGANAVKLEGWAGLEDVVPLIVQSGVPVMGHLGLTPQSVNQLGGYKVQARENGPAQTLREQARALETAGCFALVLECVPASLGQSIALNLEIPVIGIGAGCNVDGQVLVLHDLLGLYPGKKPRFVRQFMDGEDIITKAVAEYNRAVKEKSFPNDSESYA